MTRTLAKLIAAIALLALFIYTIREMAVAEIRQAYERGWTERAYFDQHRDPPPGNN
jgi:hypothetical protein